MNFVFVIQTIKNENKQQSNAGANWTLHAAGRGSCGGLRLPGGAAGRGAA